MYTQCPACQTIFSLDAAMVAQAQGVVGCGHCGASFDAIRTLCEELPAEPFQTLANHAASPSPPVLMMAVPGSQPQQQTLFDAAEAAERPPAIPSFVRHQRRTSGPRYTLRWSLGCLLLAVVLGIQMAWAKRAALIRSAVTGPALTELCRTLGCRLPNVSDLSKLHLVSRDIRPHPSVPDALIISATLRNDARFTQPYPVISVTLSNLDDQRVAMRRFKPSEYIADARTRKAGLAPGTDAALTFEVKDPGSDAVAFQFGFEPPPH